MTVIKEINTKRPFIALLPPFKNIIITEAIVINITSAIKISIPIFITLIITISSLTIYTCSPHSGQKISSEDIFAPQWAQKTNSPVVSVGISAAGASVGIAGWTYICCA